MGREKLLSIIIPVYNVEKYIERCVKSVAIRNKELVEIILVDDGSTDKSGRLCVNWQNNILATWFIKKTVGFHPQET